MVTANELELDIKDIETIFKELRDNLIHYRHKLYCLFHDYKKTKDLTLDSIWEIEHYLQNYRACQAISNKLAPIVLCDVQLEKYDEALQDFNQTAKEWLGTLERITSV